jgi:DNA-binding MarR family transcriptional regulator
MTKVTLSENESRTLLGLVKYPTLNDRQLSEVIGIKMSTVTAIKNRLKDLGYFMTVRVPNLQNLGAELLSVSYLYTNPSLSEETQAEVGRGLFEGYDELFYIGAGPRYRFSMSMHRNYTSACRVLDGVQDLYSQHGLLVPGFKGVAHLPFGQTKVYNFFDYSNLMEQDFGIHLPDRKLDAMLHDGNYSKTRAYKLSRIERKVLRGLVQNPDLLDSSISKRIDVTRQSVTKMRKRFSDMDLFFTIRIPNLEMLGFELLAMVHTTYKPPSTVKDRAKGLARVYDQLPIVFKADTDREGVELVAARTFRDFEAYMNLRSTHLWEDGSIEEEPKTLLFTFDDFIAVKNHVYSPGLTRVVESD